MATANLSEYQADSIPDAQSYSFGIVVSDWNPGVTHALLEGALNTLRKHGAQEENILIAHVPGSFELTMGGKLMAEQGHVDAVLCLGCVIRGETPHFDYVCQGVTQGVTELNLQYGLPFIFGVLTTENQQQAEERAGGKHGNKGDEAAATAIRMVLLKKQLQKDSKDSTKRHL